MTGAGAVGGAAVPGHAHKADIHAIGLLAIGQAHEGRYAPEAGHHETALRLIVL